MKYEKENFPPANSSALNMEAPNKPLTLKEGDFVFASQEEEFVIKGNLKIHWTPRVRFKIEGEVIKSSNVNLSLSSLRKDFTIKYDIYELGKGHIYKEEQYQNYSEGRHKHIIKAILLNNTITLLHKGVNADKIHLEYPNIDDFRGSVINSKNNSYMGRISWDSDKYQFTLDKIEKFDSLHEELSDNGGCMILAVGELIKKNGLMILEVYRKLHEPLSLFISFLNGRRIAPAIVKGMYKEECVWEFYNVEYIDSYKTVISWLPRYDLQNLTSMWNEFLSIYQRDKDILKVALHWYFEANSNAGFLEGSIVMIQNAHELLYNWLIVEKARILAGDDAKNISASNKLRLLLTTIKVETAIPDSLNVLKSIEPKNSKNMLDGPEIFCQVRNAIVHSELGKRTNLSKFPQRTKLEICLLGVWYVEMILLYVFRYKGKYYNRCSYSLDEKGLNEVPWNNY